MAGLKGSYQDGRFDKDAIVGKDLTCTIDGELAGIWRKAHEKL